MSDEGIYFPVRFFIDEQWIKDLLKDKKKATEILMKLSHIHSMSKTHFLSHNIMFDESFLNAISDKTIRGQGLLGFVKPRPYPHFLERETDFESKVIRYAINLADKKPYKIVILTSQEQAKKYMSNTHYSDPTVKLAIKIEYGENSEKIIDVIYSYKDN